MTDTQSSTNRSFYLWLAAITLFAAVLRLYWLSGTQPTGDEFYSIEEAFDYLLRGHYGLEMWHHPKLRNILVYYAIKLFGLNLLGFRAASIGFGILSVPLAGLIARRLTGSVTAALLAALLLAADPTHILFSRQAIQEEYVPFFSLFGVYLALCYAERGKVLTLIGCGLVFGLGLASKWNVLAPMVLSLFYICYQYWTGSGTSRREKLSELLLCCSALVVLPLTVYLVSYLPWFMHRGYDLGEWLALHQRMFAENLVHQGANPEFAMIQDHNPLHWFIRPVAFADFLMNPNLPVIVLAVSNPLAWMLTLPSVGYLMYRFKRLNPQSVLLLALFWCSYLPFAVSRRVTELNSSLAVTPFAFMVVAAALVSVLQGKPYRTRVLYGYAALVLLVALPLYVLAIGKGFGSFMQPILELYRPAHER